MKKSGISFFLSVLIFACVMASGGQLPVRAAGRSGSTGKGAVKASGILSPAREVLDRCGKNDYNADEI